MDHGNFHDGSWKFPPPIPFINISKQAAAAEGGPPEKGGDPENAAAAADQVPDKEKAARLRALLEGLRGDLVFTGDFYRRAPGWMERNGLDEGYIGWLAGECGKRRPANFRGLFYKLFFADDAAALYRGGGIPPPQEAGAAEITCPACGETHGGGLSECPRCGLARGRYGDPEEVEKQRRINALPADARREYEAEAEAAFFAAAGEKRNPAEYRDQWIEIQKKYHIIS
jgi:hypothetical protein